MKKVVLSLMIAFLCTAGLDADDSIHSTWAASDVALDTNPASPFWSASSPVYMESDRYGNSDPKFRTEVRSRWTRQNLYVLFVCPYEELNLKPNPSTSEETNELWKWDVAEVFIGSDFENIQRYKEFEISPQGEWIDLDINLDNPHHEDGWKWNSNFQVSARIDRTSHIWYGAMKIPYGSIDVRPATAGNALRVNFFRAQGPPSARHLIAWRAPMRDTFHVPQRFGVMKLEK